MNIQVNQVGKNYGRRSPALNEVSLEIGIGTFGLLGPNGAGKTTLIRILVGLIRPSCGSILIDGQDLSKRSVREVFHSVLGYLPQELGLYHQLTPREFLDYLGLMKGLSSRKKRHQKIERVIHMVGLETAIDRRLGSFSGGMKRRIGVAQALLTDPQVLIVDEPTAGLDPEERVRFRSMLAEYGRSHLVIQSTHLLEDIAQTCSRVAILDQGKLLFSGDKHALLAAVQGRVWEMEWQKPEPLPGNPFVVSSLPVQEGIRYRLLAEQPPTDEAQPLQPTLEDAYLYLLRG